VPPECRVDPSRRATSNAAATRLSTVAIIENPPSPLRLGRGSGTRQGCIDTPTSYDSNARIAGFPWFIGRMGCRT
jgi:hypothetical protein